MKTFSVKTSIQVLNYLQEKTNCYDYLKLLKLCFLADRKMLRTFGVPILYDKYYAMKFGPVCSQTKSILKQDWERLDVSKEDEELIKSSISINNENVTIKNIGTSSLSKADKDCLDFIVAKFGHFDTFDLVAITHDYPEWKKFEEQVLNSGKVCAMNYKDFFKNPTTHNAIDKFLNSDPFDEDKTTLKLAKEMFDLNYGY